MTTASMPPATASAHASAPCADGQEGLFISFEGLDGAGKTTHIAALEAAFAAQGRTVVRTREPGGTPLAERIRTLVLGEAMDALTEALLVFAARRDHVRHIIAPALAQGAVVLCDRFADAAFAYQGGGRGLDWAALQTLEHMVLRQSPQSHSPLIQPDLTLWFDLPPAVAAQRLRAARAPDRFEAESADFFAHVAAGYARRWREQAQRIARINADTTPQAVWQQVLQTVQQRGWLAA